MTNKTNLLICLIIAVGLCTSCGSTNTPVPNKNFDNMAPFGVSYEKIFPEDVAGYKLLIVEPDQYNKSEVDALKSTGATVIAYISLGEVGSYRWYFEKMKERGFLGQNENWGSYYINLADPIVYSMFFEEIIPEIMIRDFDGLFLDTVDAVAPYTNRKHLQPQMVQLIRQMRTEYPEALIIQNAGFFILSETAHLVDAALIEDVATHYNFDESSYSLKEEQSYEDKVQKITSLSKEHNIPFMIVDFAVKDSLRTTATQRLDSLSYPYFINNIQLNNISGGITGNSK